MLASIFSINVSAANANPEDIFTVSTSGFKNDKATYTISLKGGTTVCGAIVKIVFDPEALQVVDGGAVTIQDEDGNDNPIVGGFYESGMKQDENNAYTIAFANTADMNIGSSGKKFMQVTFKVKDSSRPKTTVKFYCTSFTSLKNSKLNIAHGSNELFFSETRATLGVTDISSVSASSNGIDISWKATTGATSYRIYRKADDAQGWGNPYAENIMGTSYTDENVTSGTAYKYTVRAVNSYGVNSGVGSEAGLVYLSAPSGLSASLASSGVTLKWSKRSGATGYKIYRRVVNSDGSYGSWVGVMSSKDVLTYTDSAKSLKNGTTYQYGVRAVNGSSNGVTAYCNIKYLATPSVKAAASYTGVKVSWGKIDGTKTYRVYRKVKGESSWTVLKDLDSSKSSYIDTKAPNNKVIYYTVRAYATSGGSSATKSVSLNYLKAPVPKASNTTSGVKISWSKISGAKSYIVYRKKNGDKSWTKLGTTSGASFTDKTAKNNTTYLYTVKASNGSVYSAYNTSGVKIKFVSAPTLSSASSSKSGITFKWKKVSGATGYYVYRKTGSGSYKKIATVKSGSTASYLDKTAKKGTTYTYTVRAYSGSYVSSYKTGISCKDKY